MKTVTIGPRAFAILFPDLLRPLSEAERADLRASVEARGVLVPVIVDEGDGVIDGIHRLEIAEELGLDEVPVSIRSGLGNDEKREMAKSLNKDRRQLSLEELQELRGERVARVAEKRAEGSSLRTIAEEEGISLVQVQRDLVEASTVPGGTVEPKSGEVKGRDGKTRTATPKRHDGASTSDKAAQRLARQAEASKTGVNGTPAEPQEETVEDVIRRKNGEIESFCRKLTAFVDENLPDDVWLRDLNRRQGALDKFRQGCETLRTAKCHAVCPICKGDGKHEGKSCRPCRGSGRMPKANFDQSV